MAAHYCASMLASIADGRVDRSRLLDRTITLDEAPAALTAMAEPSPVAGLTAILPGRR